MIPTETLLESLRRMLRIRFSENIIAEDFRQNKIFSFYHSSVGQEAVAVGVGMALESTDKAFGNHRSHGHYLGRGGDLYRMFCEIYGQSDGCCKGHGGSMHMLDRSVGFAGSTPILGSIAPIAVGSAFAQKASGEKAISVVFVGDGATEEGAFYESLNLAAVFKLPILFVVEDNLYAVNTPQSARRSEQYSLERVVVGLGCKYYHANGNRLMSVLSNATGARLALLVGGAPIVLHATTFRHMAHSGPITDESVREIDTKEFREEMDPIKDLLRDLMVRVSPDVLSRINHEVELEVRTAFLKAKKYD